MRAWASVMAALVAAACTDGGETAGKGGAGAAGGASRGASGASGGTTSAGSGGATGATGGAGATEGSAGGSEGGDASTPGVNAIWVWNAQAFLDPAESSKLRAYRIRRAIRAGARSARRGHAMPRKPPARSWGTRLLVAGRHCSLPANSSFASRSLVSHIARAQARAIPEEGLDR